MEMLSLLKLPPGANKLASVSLTEAGKATQWKKSITLELDDQYSTRFTIPIKREIKMPKATNVSAKSKKSGS